MAHILFTTFGSFGDLHPYLAVGIELQRLGHRVTIGTSESYRGKIEGEGIGFASIRPDVDLDDRAMLHYFFDRRQGTERVLRRMTEVVRESYQDTLEAAASADAIVTHPITFGAVLVAEQRKLPWISSVLAPLSLLSAYDPPVPAPAPWMAKLSHLGPGAVRAFWSFGKWVSGRWVRPVAALRKELGLPPGKNPMFEGANSPDLLLALFSRWFGPPQPDWPSQTVVTGFPFYEGGSAELAPELNAFLDAGAAPAVFTLGSSAVAAAGDFYRASLRAVERLGVRAVILTGSHPQDLPAVLPPSVLAWPYAPHAPLFARASVIVHQGGAGTTAQALRSGHPELVVPFAHDQFDNAARILRLGTGLTLGRHVFNARRAERAIDDLLAKPEFSRQAGVLGERIGAENGAVTAALAIHSYVARA